jgi:hypothetical protein
MAGIGIKLEMFQGLAPRVSDRLLAPMAATVAQNTKLLNGEIRGFRAPREITRFDEYFTVRRAFVVPDEGDYYDDKWLVFGNRNVDVVRSPLVNDAFDRYYIAGGGERTTMTTYSRIHNGLPPLILGVPRPVNAPTVVPGSVGSDVRSYVYTFVSAYGEEGQPSDPTLVDGDGTSTWAISGMDTTVPNAADRNIVKKRIYRTVAGEVSTAFFFVAEVALNVATYNDNQPDTTVASNQLLESTTWAEPPADLDGIVAMPNGYLIGWKGRRLLFSEPYRPHAWPAEYELSTEFPIVGAAVWGSTVVIGTESKPYFGQGTTPAGFTLEKMDAVEPCLSKRSMVATTAGVYYASINGLVMANSGGAQVITQDILTKEEWAAYNPSNIFAAQLGLQYIAFYDGSNGLVFTPTEPTVKLVTLSGFSGVVGIETDRYTGNVNLIYQDRLWEWDPEQVERFFWRWQSKVYQTPTPVNFGAIRIQFDATDNDVSDDAREYYGTYNNALFAAGVPIDTLGGHVLCGFPAQAAGEVLDWTEPEIRQPLCGGLLYDIGFQSVQTPAVRCTLYAWDKSGNRFVAFDRVVSTERILRPSTGFKSDRWQVELTGNTTVYSVQIAETPKGLATV